jgi:hypothetical protein
MICLKYTILSSISTTLLILFKKFNWIIVSMDNKYHMSLGGYITENILFNEKVISIRM